MSVGELQARLNVQLTDLRGIFEAAGVQEHSLTLLDSLILAKKAADFLTLIEGFDQSMAFVDHDDVCNRLATSWSLAGELINAERKSLKKKIAALKEDKKTDPDVLSRQEDLLSNLYIRRATAQTNTMRLKVMQRISINEFKANPLMNALERYKEVMAEQK